MLDIETLGKKHGCIVLSVALMRFGDLASASVVLDSHEQRRAGLTSDPDTIAWWRQQSPEAQAAVTHNPQPVVKGLDYISKWLTWATTTPLSAVPGPGIQAPTLVSDSLFLWCHGAGFDAPILAEVFERFGLAVPWAYWQVRDTRTLYDLAGVDLTHFSEGPRHIALNDVMAQTKAALMALGKLAPK